MNIDQAISAQPRREGSAAASGQNAAENTGGFSGLFADMASRPMNEEAEPAAAPVELTEAELEAAAAAKGRQPDLPIWPALVQSLGPAPEADDLSARSDASPREAALIAAQPPPDAQAAAAVNPDVLTTEGEAPAQALAPQVAAMLPVESDLVQTASAAEVAAPDGAVAAKTEADDAGANAASTAHADQALANGAPDDRPVADLVPPAQLPLDIRPIESSDISSAVALESDQRLRRAATSGPDAIALAQGAAAARSSGAPVINPAMANEVAAKIEAATDAVVLSAELAGEALPAEKFALNNDVLRAAVNNAVSADPLLVSPNPALGGPAAVGRGAEAALLATSNPQTVPAEQLAQHAVAVIRQMGEGRSEARIELHPAELGHLDLEMRQDGQKLEISVSVDNEQTRRLVQDQLSQWRDRLAESGMNLQRLDVEVREQPKQARQEIDGNNPHATEEADEPVNNTTGMLLRDPSRALDAYA